jgi:hypothetical protein
VGDGPPATPTAFDSGGVDAAVHDAPLSVALRPSRAVGFASADQAEQLAQLGWICDASASGVWLIVCG